MLNWWNKSRIIGLQLAAKSGQARIFLQLSWNDRTVADQLEWIYQAKPLNLAPKNHLMSWT